MGIVSNPHLAGKLFSDSFDKTVHGTGRAIVEDDVDVFHDIDDHECCFRVFFHADEEGVDILRIELESVDGERATLQEKVRFEGEMGEQLADGGATFAKVSSLAWQQHINTY